MSCETNDPRKPWEDNFGNPLPDDVLKEVSKSWHPQVWQAYLKTWEVPQREVLLPNFERVLLKRDASRAVVEYGANEARQMSESDGSLFLSQLSVKKAMLTLTFRQRQIVREVFVEGKSIKEAALNLGISDKPAIRILGRALDRLKHELASQLETKRKDLGR